MRIILKHIVVVAITLFIYLNSNAQVFTEVKIGLQIWMTKNLDVDTFQNGEKIPIVKTPEEWRYANETKSPACCYYNFDSTNGVKYGKLYNGYAVLDPRGLAPKGWHVPSYEEWIVLCEYLGGQFNAGKKMKSTSGWKFNNNGNNSSGFNAVPAGICDNGTFEYLLGDTYFWSTTESNEGLEGMIKERSLSYAHEMLNNGALSKSYGLSVRCVIDK